MESFPSTPSRSLSTSGDRFIPVRSAMDSQLSHYKLTAENASGVSTPSSSPSKKLLQSSLAETLFNSASVDQHKVLALKTKAPEPKAGFDNRFRVLYSQNQTFEKPTNVRHIPTASERVLDAPEMLDDYYVNLLDWSKDNQVVVALGASVYIWNAETGDTMQLCDLQTTNVTAVQWSQHPGYLAVGTDDNLVQIWDVNSLKLVRKMQGHSARVGALAWNNHIVSSAGRDSSILNHDVRVRDHIVSSFHGHTLEICGLTWSPDGTQLASGGNDNRLNIWELSDPSRPRHQLLEHTAAVKALAWCPFQQATLASGGGTADGTIRFWNTQTGACLQSVATGSQVCALQWSHHYKEIVSSHGYTANQAASKNTLCVWKYPSMVRIAELSGHTQRALHLAQSPDHSTIVSGSPDENLRFWRIWGQSQAETAAVKGPLKSLAKSSSRRAVTAAPTLIR